MEWFRRNGTVIVVSIDVLALSVWIGGMVVIMAALIPAVFNSFGMEEGGCLLTRVFHGYQRTLAWALAVLVVTAAGRGIYGWRSGHSSAWLPPAEVVLLGLMVGITGMIVMVLGPESVALQERAFAATGEEAKTQAYEAFFRTHMIIRGLYMADLVMAIVLVFLRMKWVGHQSGRCPAGKRQGGSIDDR